ncbi:MAG: carbon-nitrogen hydrolase family protein [Gammaproteobacteria bacterium]|jgi:predicted amidohydrolase|nr:carbon-nitrogen hydrolase family protein [Gammaproteobacteria bacterium]MDH5239166.1 carbon-nitrogen hydrolase family protein [Gammaproteobacteria bacterium]MDH5260337.1 carbon-nitrogen hydrolase family protein [Gammaproteobacteria bacterium]MDH5582600.1 carbon-nitrogen hydrolase family protein [Gammaproteobacteria bacterium]
MTTFAVAGLQLEAPGGDNVELMEREIAAVVRRYPWLDMVVCPELVACGSNHKYAEAMPGPREQRFQEIAKRHKIWLLPGSVLEADGDRCYNTAPVIAPDGTVVARHRKLFPWSPYENGITPGDQHTVFDIPGVGRFGVLICYDMWFPEAVRALIWQGAEVILHPNLTSSIERDVEKAMIRAHAAQNQCYFFDVNLAGTMGVGESLIAGPGGEVIYQAGKGREIIPLKLDLNYLHDVRRHGWQNLGQPLKSFRDSQLRFPQYENGHDAEALRALGELRMPTRDEGR